MRQHHNTLYVTSQGTWLGKADEAVEVRFKDKTKTKVPMHHLASIVAFGQVSISPYLMAACAEQGIAINYLNEQGRFLARVIGPCHGNVMLRRDQYRWADDPAACARLAQGFLLGKILNTRDLAKRRARMGDDPARKERLLGLAEALERHCDLVQAETELEVIRGHEGRAAKLWFDHYPDLLAGDPFFQWGGRSTRPPRDGVNAILSFIYMLVAHDCDSALQSVGLDPQVGFLHVAKPGRPALALDLMEEFRPLWGDRIALRLINRRMLKKGDFEVQGSGAVLLNEAGRKKVIQAYQQEKRKETRHGFLGEQTTVGLLPHLQARLLARVIRGDVSAYPPLLGVIGC
ncbi:type I-C CRISPR-associated endonuclease Cas1c [Acanthopleuribacter pedis]|uniref:CRISPR-associated endonuclease Cas1 n=1 Tax=Acanthopleuribacter pedis TaxID=442870 RepID=A0A8J7Q2N8_9BACT|nr:type I-C CRISPR-associated endonuclease Cas1c [Acanthopleuribacter pedis]MBO1319447.1 type I-C CRISPR-associated endonuclease Cas1 [Acanthopleuribacter pedis]